MDTVSRSYFTRSRCSEEFKAAGVLPIAVSSGGVVHALLGAELVNTGPKGRYMRYMWYAS